MADIVMPKMSDAMEEGTVLRWLKREGDTVRKGEPIAEIETDKASLEMEAFESGTITAIKVPEGQTVPVGTVIAELGPVGAEVAKGRIEAAVEAPPAEAERVEEARPPEAELEKPVAEEVPAAPERPAVPPPKAAPRPSEEAIKASPLARKLARDAGVDLSRIQGTGPGGRIVEEDVRRFIEGRAPVAPPPTPAEAVPPPPPTPPAPAPPAPPEAAPAAPAAETVELSRIRRTVARRMAESKRTIPHFYVTTRVKMDEALNLRQKLNQLREGRVKIGLTDMIIKACAIALTKHPDLNSSFQEEKLVRHPHANIAVAVALDEGLIAPVVPECESKSLSQIAEKTDELVEKARTGRIRPEEYSGATFTISNMGMFDVEEFQAVVVPPECAILAVGTIYPTPVVVEDAVEVAQMAKLTISADHRVTDGAGAARFLQEVKKALENPVLLLD